MSQLGARGDRGRGRGWAKTNRDQQVEGFTNGSLADADLGGDFLLAEPLSGGVFPGDDALVQEIEDLITQGFLVNQVVFYGGVCEHIQSWWFLSQLFQGKEWLSSGYYILCIIYNVGGFVKQLRVFRLGFELNFLIQIDSIPFLEVGKWKWSQNGHDISTDVRFWQGEGWG